LRLEQDQRVEPVRVMQPMFDSELFLHCRFVTVSSSILHHLHLGRSEGLGLVEEAGDGGRMSVWSDQGVERLHQAPRRAVDLSFEARVDVMFGAAPPTRSA